MLIIDFYTVKSMIFSDNTEKIDDRGGSELATRLLGEMLVTQDPVKRDVGAVRRLEPSPRKASRNTPTGNILPNQHV